MNLLQETKFIMKKYGITANKKLGQNFLINEYVVNEISTIANISKNDLIIEIGPGIGTLTKSLLENAGKVISIEIDKKMLNILNERFFLYKNFELINQDILQINLNKLIEENINSEITTCKIVANLPYYITTPIIIKLLDDKLPIKSITVMVQKEVAKRLTATPGKKEASSISHIIYFYSDSQISLEVPKNCFIPIPDVDSAVITLNFLNEPRIKIDNEKEFFKLIQTAFSQKRKTLVNSLLNNNIFSSREEAENAIISIGLDIKVRPENLSIYDFANLYKKIHK